jgi:hypothetical protein
MQSSGSRNWIIIKTLLPRKNDNERRDCMGGEGIILIQNVRSGIDVSPNAIITRLSASKHFDKHLFKAGHDNLAVSIRNIRDDITTLRSRIRRLESAGIRISGINEKLHELLPEGLEHGKGRARYDTKTTLGKIMQITLAELGQNVIYEPKEIGLQLEAIKRTLRMVTSVVVEAEKSANAKRRSFLELPIIHSLSIRDYGGEFPQDTPRKIVPVQSLVANASTFVLEEILDAKTRLAIDFAAKEEQFPVKIGGPVGIRNIGSFHSDGLLTSYQIAQLSK